MNERLKDETSNSQTLATRTRLAWQYLTDTIPHDRIIEYTIISATEASEKLVVHSYKIFDPGKDGIQLTVDSTSKLKDELVLDEANDNPMYISLQDNDVEKVTGKATEACPLETYPVQDTEESD